MYRNIEDYRDVYRNIEDERDVNGNIEDERGMIGILRLRAVCRERDDDGNIKVVL